MFEANITQRSVGINHLRIDAAGCAVVFEPQNGRGISRADPFGTRLLVDTVLPRVAGDCRLCAINNIESGRKVNDSSHCCPSQSQKMSWTRKVLSRLDRIGVVCEAIADRTEPLYGNSS